MSWQPKIAPRVLPPCQSTPPSLNSFDGLTILSFFFRYLLLILTEWASTQRSPGGRCDVPSEAFPSAPGVMRLSARGNTSNSAPHNHINPTEKKMCVSRSEKKSVNLEVRMHYGISGRMTDVLATKNSSAGASAMSVNSTFVKFL